MSSKLLNFICSTYVKPTGWLKRHLKKVFKGPFFKKGCYKKGGLSNCLGPRS